MKEEKMRDIWGAPPLDDRLTSIVGRRPLAAMAWSWRPAWHGPHAKKKFQDENDAMHRLAGTE